MLKLVNKNRKEQGLPKLHMQQDLREVARKHSRDMAKQKYFSHTNLKSQSPQTRLKLKRITEVHSGENLALIQGYNNPTQKAETGLMNSKGHRENILNPLFNCIGIGVIQNTDKTYYFTQNFARREIIFTKKIPKKIKLKKGLTIKGYTKRNIPNIICELKQGNKKNHKNIHVHKKKFKSKISFLEIGIFEIKFGIPTKKPYQFHIVNHFEIKVKKGWW